MPWWVVRAEEWIAGLAAAPPRPAEPSWADVVARVRADNPGRGAAARTLAETMGVTRRTAQRYLTGQHAPKRAAVRAAAGPLYGTLRAEAAAAHVQATRDRAARALRNIGKLRPGKVIVYDKSGRPVQTKRTIGWLDKMAAGLGKVADLWRAGKTREAGAALEKAIVNRYGGARSDARDGLADTLGVVDFPQGIAHTGR